MRKRIVMMMLLVVMLAGCGSGGAEDMFRQQDALGKEEDTPPENREREEQMRAEVSELSVVSEDMTGQNAEDERENEDAQTEEVQGNMIQGNVIQGNRIQIQVGDTVLTGELCENSSADAFMELLAEGPLTVAMSDYGNFEKVGAIGTDLPRNDEQITTVPGDIILYQGNSITIYYDTNSWNFTRLGRVVDVTKEELKEVLGTGSVEVTFSVAERHE